MNKGRRGKLTERVILKAKEVLGHGITQKELRLMAYVQYCMMNEQKIGRAHINEEEKVILNLWEKEGHIKRNAFISLWISKKFWIAINEILYLGYVDIER